MKETSITISAKAPKSGYAFDLHLLCGGYAYYSTFTRWDKWGEHYREFRTADTVDAKKFASQLSSLGQNPQLVIDKHSYDSWLTFKGWAFVSKDFAREQMTQWLKSKECVTSNASTFTDVDLCSNSSLKHYAHTKKREEVIKRDGGICLKCDRKNEDGAVLTMQHVRPYGRGGETTTRNLVTLCEECNKKMGVDEDRGLYKLAGLGSGIELGLMNKDRMTKDDFWIIARLSANLMHTRCEVW